MKARVYFPGKVVNEPVIAQTILESKSLINILRATVDEHGGDMIIDIPEKDYTKIVNLLRSRGASVSMLEKPIILNKEKCINCGACISICPTKVFSYKEDKSISVDYERCIQCGLCVNACPHQALMVHRKC
ncbi:MAG: 4Fe-4S binding protein [Candidatus Thermoplasmatota archaeon]|nr:4Fe-4S binding protein [Candidatus Thermoplasmatota archaeon]